MPDRHAWPDATLSEFLELSRQHFGLAPPRRRPDWRSLLLIGSLGALVSAPAPADSAGGCSDPAGLGAMATPGDSEETGSRGNARLSP